MAKSLEVNSADLIPTVTGFEGCAAVLSSSPAGWQEEKTGMFKR